MRLKCRTKSQNPSASRQSNLKFFCRFEVLSLLTPLTPLTSGTEASFILRIQLGKLQYLYLILILTENNHVIAVTDIFLCAHLAVYHV